MEQTLELKDIHLPEAIAWWPPAIGWWLLLLLIILAVVAIRWGVKRRQSHPRVVLRSAQLLLEQIKSDTQLDESQKLQHISTWLRRVSISRYPRSEIAGLNGQAWLEFLDTFVEGSPFSQGVGQCLADVQYRRDTPDNIDLAAIFSLCELWLKGQKK